MQVRLNFFPFKFICMWKMRLRFVYKKNKKIGLILHSISKEKDLNFDFRKIFDKRRSFLGEYFFLWKLNIVIIWRIFKQRNSFISTRCDWILQKFLTPGFSCLKRRKKMKVYELNIKLKTFILQSGWLVFYKLVNFDYFYNTKINLRKLNPF